MRSASRRSLATLGVLLGAFLAAIEGTIVATAMPTVVEHLGGLSLYSWVFTAYILTSTVTMPLWGRLSDLYGRRRFYLSAVALFLLGSALSGAAWSMGVLIAFRALQGVGAGGLLPLGMTIMGDLYTPEERPRAQSRFSIVWGIASIAGPLAGGLITEHFSWRWVFYLNLPFGILAACLVGWALTEREVHREHTIDARGAAALAGSVTLLLLALGQLGRAQDASPSGLLATAAGGVVLGLVFVALERRSKEPILPLDLLRDRHVASATLTGLLAGVATFGALSYVPLFVQAALGSSATQAGSVLTPMLLGWVTLSVVTGRVLPRIGYRGMVTLGQLLVTAGFFGLLAMSHDSSIWMIYADLTVMGTGMGMTMLPLILAQQNAVTPERLGTVTSLGQFSRSIGGALGVAMMGAVMAASLGTVRPDVVAGSDVLETALHRAFIAAAGVSVLALLSTVFVPSGFTVARRRESAPAAAGGGSS